MNQEADVHMERLHIEGRAGTEEEAAASTSAMEHEIRPQQEDGDYAECPVCEEVFMLNLMDYHMELHDQEDDSDHAATQVVDPSSSRRQKDHREEARDERPPSTRHRRSISPPASSPARRSRWKKRLASTIPGGMQLSPTANSSTEKKKKKRTMAVARIPGMRLGSKELGRHAYEDRMPDWLVTLLRKEGQVVQAGVVPVLEQLLNRNSSTKYAYLCHPCVHHVSRLKKEGGFCGYRNIQTMASYIIGTRFPGHEHFAKKLPSVFRIQDYVEAAWDAGINSECRAETGGIKMTRKFIGTPEAASMFRFLDIPCETMAFKSPEAESLLLQEVEAYFASGVVDPERRVRATGRPPIYLQHLGHSMTIVGFERKKSGRGYLLVFDPSFRDPWAVRKMAGSADLRALDMYVPILLNAYRRGHKYLRIHKAFELLRLQQQPPETEPTEDTAE